MDNSLMMGELVIFAGTGDARLDGVAGKVVGITMPDYLAVAFLLDPPDGYYPVINISKHCVQQARVVPIK